jgi:D-aspartate ligase
MGLVANFFNRKRSIPHHEAICIANTSVPVVVLVSSQHGGVSLIRSLGRVGVRVYSIHEDSGEPAARSRYLRGVLRWNFSSAPRTDSIAFLVNLAEGIGTAPILIPTSDTTAIFVAENASVLGQQYFIATPPLEVVRCFFSKKRTADLCQEIGIPTPRTELPRSRQELLNFAEQATFPVIVKGECGEFWLRVDHAGRVAVVATRKDLLNLYDLNAETSSQRMIIQEYIPGGDDAVWMFNGFFNDRSECLFGATGRKLRQFPPHRGSTSLGICTRNEVVEAQTKQLMKAVAYRGPLDVGYRFDARDGKYKLLDVNPRIGSTFRLFAAQNGLDVARALYLDLTGQSVPFAQVSEGRKWMVESNDLISSWTDFRERRLTPSGWWRSVRDVEEGVWLAHDDLKPLAMLPVLWFRKRWRPRRALLRRVPARPLSKT